MAKKGLTAFPLAVVVPHYGDPALTRDCIAAVMRTGVKGTRVYVVDGRRAAPLPRGRHRVITLDPAGAAGFAAICNLAAARAFDDGAAAVLLLNNDAIIDAEAPGQLLAFAGETGAGVVAPVVLTRADPAVVETAGIEFNAATGRVRHWYAGKPYAAIRYEYRFFEAVTGTAMLVTRGAYGAAGGLFDPALTFYFEDVDFCLRARANGVRIAVLRAARVWHAGAASFQGPRAAERARLVARHHLEVVARHGRPLPAALRLAREGHIIMLNAAYFAFRERAPFGGVAAVLRGAREYYEER